MVILVVEVVVHVTLIVVTRRGRGRVRVLVVFVFVSWMNVLIAYVVVVACIVIVVVGAHIVVIVLVRVILFVFVLSVFVIVVIILLAFVLLLLMMLAVLFFMVTMVTTVGTCVFSDSTSSSIRRICGRRRGFLAYGFRYAAHFDSVDGHAHGNALLKATLLTPIAILGREHARVAEEAAVVLITINAPFEEAFAALARGHSVVYTRCFVVTHLAHAERKRALGLLDRWRASSTAAAETSRRGGG
jgi:hypothetical protein